ncbi:MAG: M1 family metallopeptidase, partial [Deltaproteobacteria bacterium]|nr:M1 family metallopeptidase [Deltaproteobacteria bacterium]
IQQPGDCVAVRYRTAPDARALLWVEPSGTSGKRAPMLFTQSQAILARSWVPLQDTPSVRFTYDATIHVPDKLWAVMSAENLQAPPADGPAGDRAWHFEMKQPIPSYLLALAVGELAFRKIGERTGIYAEPGVVDAAAAEFVEVDAMMAAAEKLYGPYPWGRYDMLVLPPSFPYGGMENPRLTFLTPTVITGDRTLVSLIAHELAHSWSGNLVTNATWADFWLNEGFTTYVERRIMEALRGREQADVLWELGARELDVAFKGTKPADTRLAMQSSVDRDPEDVPGDAAYEKGALFLRTLEQAFGREVFDAFMRRRFARLAFKSTDTATFELDVQRELIAKYPGKFSAAQLASWLHDPMLPAGLVPTQSKRIAEIDALAASYAKAGTAFDTSAWQTLDWVMFLKALPPTITLERLQSLDAKYRFTASQNAEIGMYWLPIIVRADGRDAAPAVEAYLLRVGRARNLRPLYTALVEKGGAWRDLARLTFARARSQYHPIVREDFAKLVGG